MILIIIAILSVIVGLIRRGSFSNIGSAGLRAWFLILLSVLMFMGVLVGDYLGIEIVQNYAFIFLMASYALLIMGLLFNLNIWTFIILLGALLNFVVIFINGGKMPLSSDMIGLAGMSVQAIQASAIQEIATSSTHLPMLGGIIPIPLPSILAQVISPGTAVIGLGLFFEIQNLLTGASIDYEDEDDEEDEEEQTGAKHSAKNERDVQAEEEEKTQEAENDEDLSFGKDYTAGNIDIHEQTGALPTDDSLAEPEAGDTEAGTSVSQEEFENTAAFFDTLQPYSESGEAQEDDPAFDAFDELNKSFEEKNEIEDADQDDEDAFENSLGGFETQDGEFGEQTADPYAQMPADVEETDDEAEYDEASPAPVASPEDVYDKYSAEDLTLKKDALIEAKAAIDSDLAPGSEKTAQPAAQGKVPLEVDTDSPFIIVNGRIVENPYYKFRRGGKDDDLTSSGPIGNGVYFIKGRNPSMSGRPNFSAPPSVPAQPAPKNEPAEAGKPDDGSADPNGYERVEMQIGDVQIKFWKKENN